MKHKVVAIIPARGGSKRIPRKNLIKLGNMPLIAYSIKTALESKYFKGLVYVSTEDKNIASISQKYGAKIIQRPIDLAGDNSTTLSVLQHAVKTLEKQGLDFDTVVLLQATCPFRKTFTINNGIRKLWTNWNKYKVIFSVRLSRFSPNWLLKISNEKLKFILPNDHSKIRSQDLNQVYEIDGVLYVYKKDHLMTSKKYPFAENASGYIITDKKEAIDIDDLDDLAIARAIINYRQN